MSHLQGLGLAVLPPHLHGVAAVIPAVLQRQVHHHDVESPVVVGDKLHAAVAALPPVGGPGGAVGRRAVVPAGLHVVQLPLGQVADVLLLAAALVAGAAEVPGFVEQVVAVGQGPAHPAAQGDVLPLRADAARVGRRHQQRQRPSCGRGEWGQDGSKGDRGDGQGLRGAISSPDVTNTGTNQAP